VPSSTASETACPASCTVRSTRCPSSWPPPSSDPTPSTRTLKALAAAAAAFALASALWAAWRQDTTTDEPIHLAWSRRLLDSRVTERRSDIHFNSKTPVVMANVAARKLAKRFTRDETTLRFACRLPTVGWLALLLAGTLALGRAAAGEAAGWWALLLAALDPNLVAHGSLATVDVAYACATVLTLLAALRFARRPAPGRAALLGVALGLAFAAKFTAFLLLPAVLLLPLARAERPRRAEVLRLLGGAALALAVCALAVCASYLFVDVGFRLRDVAWKSGAFVAMAGRLPDLWLPLPVDFLTGVDVCLGSERAKSFPVVVLSELHPSGVWYYFAFLWLVKTPLLVLAAQAAGLGVAARRGLLLSSPGLRFLLANLVLTAAYFSFVYRMQIGYRFVLMCIPLLGVLAAAGLGAWRPRAWAAWAVAATAVLEQVPYLGNTLAFTNAAVRPKERVFTLIADSNVDFGQNDAQATPWIRARAAAGAHVEPVHVLPGDNVVNFNLASGAGLFPRHRWVRAHLTPREHYRHTYLLFQVTPAQFERFLTEARRFVPGASVERWCAGGSPPTPLQPGLPLSVRSGRPGQATVVCLDTPAPLELVLRGRSGVAFFGAAAAERAAWDRIGPGQEAWFRLEAGRHAFGATARAFDGWWEPHAGGAVLTTRATVLDEGRLVEPDEVVIPTDLGGGRTMSEEGPAPPPSLPAPPPATR
jgi:hypothetical protein